MEPFIYTFFYSTICYDCILESFAHVSQGRLGVVTFLEVVLFLCVHAVNKVRWS